nr:hypothetical protein [Tanacetum cinerariifolium]
MLEDPYVEVALQAPPSPDYIPGPEEPEQAPPLPDYVPGPEYADDEIVAEDASPTAQSPEYVPEFDLEAHLEDDDDEDPVDYPADGGDDGDDVEGISFPAPVPMPAWSDSEVVRLLAMSSPPASPLSLWSSPPPQIPFPPLPSILSLPSPVLSPTPPPSPIHSLGYRAAMIRLRAEAASTSHSPPLPPPFILSLPDQMHLHQGHHDSYLYQLLLHYHHCNYPLLVAGRTDPRPTGGLRADYGFVATMDREIMRDPEREFKTRVSQDTDEIYMRLNDEQSERQLLAGRLNMLFRDRRTHAYTRHLMETEARLSREAWVRLTDTSDLVRGEVMSLRTTVLRQMTKIRELHAADRRRQIMILEMLRADHRRSIEIIELRTALQRQVTALQG